MKKYRCVVYSNVGVILFKTTFEELTKNYTIKNLLKEKFPDCKIDIEGKKINK
jgi:hypothetical protein